LGGDPDAVGRTVRLGGEETTVVGVMPEGYGFPVNQTSGYPSGWFRPATHPGRDRAS
jgi:hypothetical protein